ncbi:MAG: stage II sporulation protein R [Clostridiales bacterium]
MKIITSIKSHKKKLLMGGLICFLLSIGIGGAYLSQAIPITNSPLRLHVIANSDTPYDQQVKLIIRDKVLSLLNQELTHAKNKEDAMAKVNQLLPQLEKECALVLADFADYGLKAKLDNSQFTTKAYGDKVLPAGEYDALKVILGEGEGKNWWCVLFPPLCFIDIAAKKATDQDLSPENFDPAQNNQDNTIVDNPQQVAPALASTLEIKLKLKELLNWD